MIDKYIVLSPNSLLQLEQKSYISVWAPLLSIFLLSSTFYFKIIYIILKFVYIFRNFT